MKFILNIILLFMGATSLVTNGFKIENKQQTNDLETVDYDYLVFRERWPATTCMFPGSNVCTIAKNITTWVVHGLWPTIKKVIGPNYCDKTKPFNFDSIKWMLPQLLKYWPNLYTNTTLESFWEHEWEKHGTCANGLSEIQSESDFFNVTLNLLGKYNFGPILEQNGIVPNDTLLVDLGKIKNAIKSELKVEPMIVCFVLKDSGIQYLSQMQVCMSKQFELVDCLFEPDKILDSNKAQEIQCQPDIPIRYPTIKHVN